MARTGRSFPSRRTNWSKRALAPVTVAIGLVTETETARALTYAKALTIARVIETETSQLLTFSKLLAIGHVTETESASALTYSKALAVARVIEIESARALTYLKALAMAQVVELETARALAHYKAFAIGRITEAETARALTPSLGGAPQTVAIGRVTESESAQPLAASVSGADTAAPTSAYGNQDQIGRFRPPPRDLVPRTVPIGQVVEHEAAGPLVPVLAPWPDTSVSDALRALRGIQRRVVRQAVAIIAADARAARALAREVAVAKEYVTAGVTKSLNYARIREEDELLLLGLLDTQTVAFKRVVKPLSERAATIAVSWDMSAAERSAALGGSVTELARIKYDGDKKQARLLIDNLRHAADTADQFDDIVAFGYQQWQWKTVHDDRVDDICSERDGEVFDIDEVFEPAHPNCRCFAVPHGEPAEEEVGDNLDEFFGELKPSKLSDSRVAGRAWTEGNGEMEDIRRVIADPSLEFKQTPTKRVGEFTGLKSNDAKAAAKSLLTELETSKPKDYTLYRGIKVADPKVLDEFTEGKSLNLNLSSWSSNEKVAKNFSEDIYRTSSLPRGTNGTAVIFRVDGARAIDLSDVAAQGSSFAEHLSGGQFVVKSIEVISETEPGLVGRMLVTLVQNGVRFVQ